MPFACMFRLVAVAALYCVQLVANADATDAANANPNANATETVTRIERELNDAPMACDAAALGRLWADDMTFVFSNGAEETRTQRLDGLADCTPGAQRSTVKSIAITDLGDTVVALVLSEWSSSFNGKPFATEFRATHVWTRRKSAWVLVAAHLSQLKR
jgi:ketosteroid isomerase-like protein